VGEDLGDDGGVGQGRDRAEPAVATRARERVDAVRASEEHGPLEDEQVVEAVQRGVRSRLYRRRRFSPGREAGVHHFHRLLAAALA
jgi:hypothetical protein